MKRRSLVGLCSTLLVAAMGASVSAVGCGGSEPPAKSPDETASSSDSTPTPPPADSSAVAAGSEPGRAAGTDTPAASAAPPPVSAPPADPALTDEQILQVTHTANAGEIEQAKLAQTKAKDPRVKKLAAMMIKDHGAADGKGTKLAKKDSLTPAPSPTSTSLEGDASGNTTTLQGQKGADFDKSYVDTQVKEHQAVLDIIDQKLIPAAKNADVKSYLDDVRAAVAMHLKHAQELQGALAK